MSMGQLSSKKQQQNQIQTSERLQIVRHEQISVHIDYSISKISCPNFNPNQIVPGHYLLSKLNKHEKIIIFLSRDNRQQEF
jgi:hypothetical protein